MDDWGFASEDYDAYLKKLEKGYDAYFQVITPTTDIDDIYDGPLFDNPALGLNLVHPPKPIRVNVRPEDFLDDLPGGGGSGGSGGGGGGMGGGGFNIPVYKGVGDYIFNASDYIQQVLDYIKTQDLSGGLGTVYQFEKIEKGSPDVDRARAHALADLFGKLGDGLTEAALPGTLLAGAGLLFELLGYFCDTFEDMIRPTTGSNPWGSGGSNFVDP